MIEESKNQVMSENIQSDHLLNVEELIKLIQSGLDKQREAIGKDAILLVGPTGSGKSTTVNYLLGQKMERKKVEIEYNLKNYHPQKCQVERIESDGDFKIGHTKGSETSELKIALTQNGFYLCDSPGFFDNRGFMVEIANASILQNFLKSCKTVRLVLLISYPELTAQRGTLFNHILKLIQRILVNGDKDSFSKILFFFTKIPSDQDQNSIIAEINSLYELIEDNEDDESIITIQILTAILNQLHEKQVTVHPMDGNYKKLLHSIMKHTPFTKPSQEFCFSISDISQDKIYNYIKNIANQCERLIKKGEIKQIIDNLIHFKLLRDYTEDKYLEESFSLLETSLSNQIETIIQKAISDFVSACLNGVIVSQQNIQEILKVQSYLKIIDEYKADIFSSFKFSEEIFKQEIESVCQSVYEQISQNLSQNIDDIKINLQKLKDFSDQTQLGRVQYDQCLEELNSIYQKQNEELSNLIEAFYKREDKPEKITLKRMILKLSESLDRIKCLQGYLNQFSKNKQFRYYEEFIRLLADKNEELNKKIQNFIISFKANYIKYSHLDNENGSLVMEQEIEILPQFEVIVLRLLSEDLRYSTHVKGQEEGYNYQIRSIIDMNSEILNFLKEDREDDFNINNLEQILQQMAEIRKLDDYIFKQTDSEYNLFKQDLRQKISKKVNDANSLLEQYTEEMDEENEDIEKEQRERKSKLNKQRKDFSKLKSIYEYLNNMKWSDKYLQRQYTENALRKFTILLNEYVDWCLAQILKLNSNEEYDQLQLFVSRLIIIKGLHKIVDFSEQIESSLIQVENSIIQRIAYINTYVQNLNKVTHYNNTHWYILNSYITKLKQISELRELNHYLEIKSQSDNTTQKITEFMQEYYKNNLQIIQYPEQLLSRICQENQVESIQEVNLNSNINKIEADKLVSNINNIEADKLVSNKHFNHTNFKQSNPKVQQCFQRLEEQFKQQSIFLNEAKIISSKYQELQKLVGTNNTYKNLIDEVKISFGAMIQTYKNNQVEVQDLQIIQNSYQALYLFVKNMSDLSCLYEQFQQLDPPKNAISEAFKQLESAFQSGQFQYLKYNLMQLKNLENEKDKSNLLFTFKRLKEKFNQEIQTAGILIKRLAKKCIDDESRDKIMLHLKNVSDIREILYDYKKNLFEEPLKVQLSTLLEELKEDFLQVQKEQITNLTKMLQFSSMEDNYQNFTLFYQTMKNFKNLFDKEQWKDNVHSLFETIKTSIQQTIESLHTQNTQKLEEYDYLLNLRAALIQAEKDQLEFKLSYEKVRKLTEEKIIESYGDLKQSILSQIPINQQTIKLKNKIEKFKQLGMNLKNRDMSQIIDLEGDQDEIEEMLNDKLKEENATLSSLIQEKRFKDATILINKIKSTNDYSYERIIQNIKSTIKASINEIKEYYPLIEPSQFGNLFKKVLNNLQLREKFGQEKEEFEKMAQQLIDYLLTKSEQLFSEIERIVVSDELSFSKSDFEQLFKHESYFSIIGEETKTTAKYTKLNNNLHSIFNRILTGLKGLYEGQQILLNRLEIPSQTIKKVCSTKFEELLKIAKTDSELLNKNQFLIQIKETSAKLFSQEEIIEKIRAKFKALEDELINSFERNQFQNVKICIHQLKKSSLFNQIFKQEFVDLTSLFKQVEIKIIDMTKKAQLIIQNDIQYDHKLNDLINSICNVDEHLSNIEELKIPSQMSLVISTISNKLDEEIQRSEHIESNDSGSLRMVADMMITFQKISENVTKFTDIINRKLQEIISKVEKVHGMDIIYYLGSILKEDPSGAAIVYKNQKFSSYQNQRFNELVGKHDINYIFDKLELSQDGKEKQKISPDLRNELNSFYQIYDQKYSKTVEVYQFKSKEDWNKIIVQAKDISQEINLPNSSWEDASKKKLINMIALICAYWSLISSGRAQKGQKIVFKKPNHTQILSVIMLLGVHEKDGFILGLKKRFQQRNQCKFQNKLIEIRTGEGKSLTLGFSAITLALLGCEVDVVCYSKYLSQRDEEEFQQLFQSFGVSYKIKYGTFKDQAERYLQKHLDVREGVLQFIEGQSIERNNQIPQPESLKVVLIDEVDIFFNLDYYGKTYNPCSTFYTQEIENIIRNIWQKRDANSINLQDIMNSVDYSILMSKYAMFKGYIDRQIKELCIRVKYYKHHFNNVKYIVKDNKIGYKQVDSSLSFSTSYGYDTLFAYFYQNFLGQINDESLQRKICFKLSCGNISYALLPNSYTAILGVTGTLESLNASMKKSLKKYNITSEIYMPSMFGLSNLNFKEVDMTNVEPDKENQYLRIQEISAAAAVSNNQAVLIFFKDTQSLKDYRSSKYIAIPQEKYIKISEHTYSSDIDSQVQRSTQSHQISLFTREYGRGTDFVSFDKNVIKEGGVVVIQTFLSDSKTEEIQIKGRTARQGEHGKYYLVLNQKDLESDYKLQPSQITQWKNNQSVDSLYKKLTQLRDQQENKKFDDIEQTIQLAKQNHQSSIQFYKDLKNNNKANAIEYINKYS